MAAQGQGDKSNSFWYEGGEQFEIKLEAHVCNRSLKEWDEMLCAV